ncbi:MAG: DUF975 family protein [Treponema sp.]|jgi:uncharacterized membrane protein|nr:DUF975 family protein [Treponema sp.]
MFDRKMYKLFARRELKGRWTIPVLSTLIVVCIKEIFNIPYFIQLLRSVQASHEITLKADFLELYRTMEPAVATPALQISQYIAIFVTIILSFALLHLYLKMSESPAPVTFNTFLEGLNLWLRAILASLWFCLWSFLWLLLFIIPGLVKAVSYSQMFYLVAEYPHMSITKAMKISKIMTRGSKGDLFIMYLSFIGWAILASLTLGIGYLWLSPYVNLSFVNSYRALKKQSVEKGELSLSDFC